MFQNSPIIAFLATPYNQPTQKSIRGTIEKVINDSDFLLRIGSDRIAIKVEKGSLQAGDIVNCTVNKNSLVLEKITPLQNPSLLKNDSFISNYSHVPQGKVVILMDIPSQIPEGLYKFGNAAQALSFIGKDGPYDTNSSEPAYLRIISSGNKETAALLLDQKEALKVINSWPGNFLSNALKSLNPDIYKEIIEMQGSLRLDNLHQIDKLLASSQLPAPATRAGSASAQEFASTQWLKIALENESLIESLVSRFPSYSASGFAASLEETISSLQLQNDRESATSLLQKAAITPEIFDTLDKTEVIPQVATNLGYDLENQLLSGNIPSNTVKVEMLRMIENISSLQSSVSQIDFGNTLINALQGITPEDLNAAAADILDRTQKELRQLLFDKNACLLPGSDSLSLRCSAILQQTVRQIEALLSSTGLQDINFSNFPAEVLTELSSLQSDALPENIDILFKKIFSLIPEFSASSETAAFAPGNLNSLMGLFSEINNLEKSYQNENGSSPTTEFQIDTSKSRTDFALSECIRKFSNQIQDIIGNFQKNNQSTPQTTQNSIPMGSFNISSPSFAGIEVHLAEIRFDILKAFSSFSAGADSTQDMLQTAGRQTAAPATKEIIDNFSKAISPDILDLIQKRLSGIKLLVETISAVSTQNQNLQGASESFLEKCALLQKVIPDAVKPAVTQTQLVKTTLDQLDNFVSDINKFNSLSGKSLAEAVNDLSLKGAAPQVLRSVEIHLSGILNRLTSKLNETIDKIENIRSDIELLTRETGSAQSHKNSRVSDQNDNITSQSQTGQKQIEDSSLLRQIPSRQLENLLTRLESLQLLSRQLPSSSGEQQILALPMKIGNEWTEVNIRFVKNRSAGKNAGDKRHFSVMLNVAPSRLGAIEITMEYEFKKFLKLNMEFESRETENWFSSQRDTLKEAIKELGVPLTHFELHVRTPALSIETGETITDNGNFDIRI